MPLHQPAFAVGNESFGSLDLGAADVDAEHPVAECREVTGHGYATATAPHGAEASGYQAEQLSGCDEEGHPELAEPRGVPVVRPAALLNEPVPE